MVLKEWRSVVVAVDAADAAAVLVGRGGGSVAVGADADAVVNVRDSASECAAILDGSAVWRIVVGAAFVVLESVCQTVDAGSSVVEASTFHLGFLAADAYVAASFVAAAAAAAVVVVVVVVP